MPTAFVCGFTTRPSRASRGPAVPRSRSAASCLTCDPEALLRDSDFVTHSVFESVYLSSRIAVFSARPGHVAAQIEIDAPLARDDAFRLSPLYAQACKEASDALHKAMGEA